METNLLNGVTLAYMGDAVWSLYVREHLIEKGITKADRLQKLSVKYVSAKGQAKLFYYLEENDILSNDEMDVYKRGRNSKSNSTPKNTDVQTYRISTGFEALIGHLYLSDQKTRIDEIFEIATNIIK